MSYKKIILVYCNIYLNLPTSCLLTHSYHINIIKLTSDLKNKTTILFVTDSKYNGYRLLRNYNDKANWSKSKQKFKKMFTSRN